MLRNTFKREEGGLETLTGKALGGRDGINTRRAGGMKEMEQSAQTGFQNATVLEKKLVFCHLAGVEAEESLLPKMALY